MKTTLTVLIFAIFLSIGIYLDSLVVGFITSFLTSVSLGWMVCVKVFLWTVLAYFTGGLIFAASFIASGAVRNSLDK